MAMTKVKNLQLWCKKMADGYRDVEVRDMASSWKSGLAFCAIIHRFRPDLIDYDSLSKENVFDNNNLAFEVAEKQLSIPAFLEAQDMVAIKVPDKLSVVTYVSQYYNYFHNKPQLGGPGVNEFKKGGKKKDNVITADQKMLTPTHLNTGKAVIKQDRQESMGDKCSICHNKVYLLERHIDNGKLYHRSCYRKSELSPQSRLSKRQPNRSADEEINDSSKLRKLDHDKNEPNNKHLEPGSDFWQRRAEAKAKDLMNPSTQNVTPISKTDDVPWLKKKETPVDRGAKSVNEKDDVVMHSPKSKTKFDKGDLFSKNKQNDSGLKGNKLADKFKELNERNLKSSQSDPKVLESNDNKAVKDTSSHTPVAKPRQNIVSKGEKMDTSESSAVVTPHPRPVPRFKVKIPPRSDQEKDSSKSEGKKNEVPQPKSHQTKHNDVTLSSKEQIVKPKTPPFKHKEFSKPSSPKQKPKSDLSSRTTSNSKADDDSSSAPPPLPSSVPPQLPMSSPPHPAKKDKTSPTASPRQPIKTFHKKDNTHKRLSPKEPDKAIHDYSKGADSNNFAPAKPPRISTNLNDTKTVRDITPMDTDTFAPAKAVFHEPQPEQKAYVSEPKRHNIEDSKKDREVVGGLLKSLADVRHKHDAEKKTSEKNVTDKKFSTPHIGVANVDSDKERVEIRTKQKTDDRAVKFSNKLPPRPKSSFVSSRSEPFVSEGKSESQTNLTKHSGDKTLLDDKQGVKTNVTEKTVVTTKTVTTVIKDDTPEWKRQLDKQKAAGQRPKSADILSSKSDNDSKPDWQKEAERRMVARKGAYVDPEKVKANDILKRPEKISDSDKNNVQPVTRPLSPTPRKSGDITDQYASNKDKGKLEEKAKPNEKRRILPVAPKGKDLSPPRQQEDKKKISVGTKFVFDDTEPKKPQHQIDIPRSPGPPRPPQPVIIKTGKVHMSAYQVQKELEKIDSKLTELELKGRNLEDSIRKAKEEEEDDLMIDWFKLVSEKNDLVRQEADIIYLSREQELEAEQKMVEKQLRELVDKPDLDKSTEDQQEEDYLMQKFLGLVNQRNCIVDNMDEDRIRYIEEDRDIEQMLKDKGFSKNRKDGKLKKDKKKSKLL